MKTYLGLTRPKKLKCNEGCAAEFLSSLAADPLSYLNFVHE